MTLLIKIRDAYDRLAVGLNPTDELLHVEKIPGFEWARLGVKHDAVVLLLPPDEDREGRHYDLEHVWISPKTSYEIQESNTFRVETVAVISTKSQDVQFVNTFLELIAMLFDVGVRSDPGSVRNLIQDLVALFRDLTQPSRKSIQGLWGELFLINQSANVELSVRAWHTTPHDRYDFGWKHERVEVKTTMGPRIHTFAHAQLASVLGLRITIASLILNPVSEGRTCADLANRILGKLHCDSLRRSFVGQVVRTLGVNWQNQSSCRFDLDQAAQDLRFFDVEVVPKIKSSIPPNIFDVSYKSDLQVVSEMRRGVLDSRDEFTVALFNK